MLTRLLTQRRPEPFARNLAQNRSVEISCDICAMLAHTFTCLRTRLGSLHSAGHSHALLATSAAQRLQHAEAYEACGDALQEFRETVKEFAQRTVAPHAADIDRLNSFPKSTNLWKEIGEFGLHGKRSRDRSSDGSSQLSFHNTAGKHQPPALQV